MVGGGCHRVEDQIGCYGGIRFIAFYFFGGFFGNFCGLHPALFLQDHCGITVPLIAYSTYQRSYRVAEIKNYEKQL